MTNQDGKSVHAFRIDYLDFTGIFLRTSNMIYMKPNGKVKVGDQLTLEEYDNEYNEYSGNHLRCVVLEIESVPKHFFGSAMVGVKIAVV